MKVFLKQYYKHLLHFDTLLLGLYFLIAFLTQNPLNLKTTTCVNLLTLPLLFSPQYNLKFRYRCGIALAIVLVMVPLLDFFQISPLSLSYLQASLFLLLLCCLLLYHHRDFFRNAFVKGQHNK